MNEDVQKVIKSYMEKIKEKEAQYQQLGNILKSEQANLKKIHGPDRKIRKTDACYNDYMEFQRVDKEKKQLQSDMKAEVESIKKNAL